jgi:hypothetical protein
LATTTSTGLEVRCELDANKYPKGLTISDAEMAALDVEYAESTANGSTRSARQPLGSSA